MYFCRDKNYITTDTRRVFVLKWSVARARWGMTVLFGIGVFLFWLLCYPHALSYQEQYQLFLFSLDYLAHRLAVPGGLADYLGEFLVQFYYYSWSGALVLAVLLMLAQRLTWCVINSKSSFYILSFVPSIMLLWLLGDPSVLLSYIVALCMVMIPMVLPWQKHGSLCRDAVFDAVIIPLFYWLVGPMAWLYVALRVVDKSWRWSWVLFWMLTVQLLAYHFILTQWPFHTAIWGTYYRIPLQINALMWIIPVVIVLIAMLSKVFARKEGHYLWLRYTLQIASIVVLGFFSLTKGYDKEMYELIHQDYLVRQERWDDIVERAKQYQVQTPFSSVCVNLALSQKRQLADRMFVFYQSGVDALVMPRIRDLTSMLPTAEVFWRLGMVNSAQRYMFDTQESILNAKKSGRCTKRIAECMLVNGHYQVARKQLDLLKKSLFYRQWALETEKLLGNETMINMHPVYGKLRRLRYKDDFLFSYDEIDKMFGLLFVNNPENRMALDYFMGQMLLNRNLGGFQQYMSWVQQYGGYQMMPLGYQDVMMCIQRKGDVEGSPYRRYVDRQMRK